LAPQPLAADLIVALAAVAQPMHRLGDQADVAHHRYAAPHQPVDQGQGLRLGAFKFHSCGGGLLEHPAGGSYCVIWVALIAEEGQIANKQGHLPRAAAAG